MCRAEGGGVAAQFGRPCLQPTRAVVHVGDLRGIDMFGCLAELDGGDQYAGSRQGAVDILVVQIAAVTPGPAVHIEQDSERTVALGAVQAHRPIAVRSAAVDLFRDIDIELCGRVVCRRHSAAPEFLCMRRHTVSGVAGPSSRSTP